MTKTAPTETKERPAPKIRSSRNLPIPRLEIRWKVKSAERRDAEYYLVMPAQKYDIRNVFEYKRDGYFKVLVSRVECSGSPVGPGTSWPQWPFYDNGAIYAPFRDSSHIAWDAHVLNLPAFIVHGRKAQIVDATPSPDPDAKKAS